MPELDTGTWRDFWVGVDPHWADPEWADGATDQPGDPGAPISTRFEGGAAGVFPWWEGLEDPASPIGLPFTESPNPSYPDESVGGRELPGAYEGAYRTHGPVRAWGHEPSGGPWGDQAIGRIMRFPANVPDRYDRNGVWNTDYRDELAAGLLANQAPQLSDTQVTTNLIMWPNVESY